MFKCVGLSVNKVTGYELDDRGSSLDSDHHGQNCSGASSVLIGALSMGLK